MFGTCENGDLDEECFIVIKKPISLNEIVNRVHNEWGNYEINKLRILPIKMSQMKSIKQTIELV